MAGKTFSTPEEAGVTPPTEAELAHARKLFDEVQERIDNLTEADLWTEVSPKFGTTPLAPSTRAGETGRAMSKEVAGRTFSTPEEAGVTPPTEAEIAHARKLFDEFQEQIDRVPEADIPTEVSSKFFDDVSGTEYEGRPRS